MFQLFLRHSFALLSSRSGSLHIRLIFESPKRSVIEIRGNNYRASDGATRRDLDGLALSGSDEAALLAAEFGHRY
ncbi:hypothetical protein SAMN04489752_1901 [Brevibacterium siliguriense]|uniref:Uncharacterized protein n=1 Tax=Brevibacterium siliguriense TaxID=1136497 RepID=A0A1H1SXG2_9MICO|nr:hypothetical protein SAMN04489752_1901 [Brevibacterium siliguriense]